MEETTFKAPPPQCSDWCYLGVGNVQTSCTEAMLYLLFLIHVQDVVANKLTRDTQAMNIPSMYTAHLTNTHNIL